MRYNQVELIGVNAVQRIFIEDLNWIFREQPLVDVGIDAMIEAVINQNPSGKFLGAQIKSGKGNFHVKEKSYTYYASDIHYNYWTNSNIPIILIGYIPEEKTAYWTHLTSQKFVRTKRQWKIDIPKKQKLNSNSEKRLLNLLDISVEVEVNDKWTVDRINEISSDAKNISKSSEYVNKLASHLDHLNSVQDVANIKFRKLAEEGKNLSDYQTRLVVNELVNEIKQRTPLMEEDVNEFSRLFAIGIDAFQKLVIGCKELNIHHVLENILPSIKPMPITAEDSIKQIDDLIVTVDKFSKKDRGLKEANMVLSEVLKLISREFTVAKDLTNQIIELIEE